MSARDAVVELDVHVDVDEPVGAASSP